MIYPQKLKKNDKVAIIAPSSSMHGLSKARLNRAAKLLRSLGLLPVYGKNLKEADRFKSSSVKARLEDLNWAFGDPTIKAVMCVTGGYSANQLLNFIDWKLIKANPKIFCGYSDITILCAAIAQKTGLVTYYGPNLLSLGVRKTINYTSEYLRKVFFVNDWADISPSKRWSDDDLKIVRNRGPFVIREGRATGTANGGNLGTVFLLQGTKYFLGYSKNTILFVEDDDLVGKWTPQEFDRRLRSLFQQTGSNNIRVVLIGGETRIAATSRSIKIELKY